MRKATTANERGRQTERKRYYNASRCGVVQAELCIYSSLKRLPVARTASLMLPDFLEFYGVRRSAAIRRGIAAAFLHTKRIAVASGSPRVTNRALYFTFNNDGYILS